MDREIRFDPPLMGEPFFPNFPTIEQIQQATKEELLKQYSCGCTPLRHAVKHGASLEVVRLLLDRAPEALDIRNSHGNIVLSHVKTQTIKEVALLVAERTSQENLLRLDLDGDYPLHCLLQNKAHEDVINLVIEKCPEMVFSHKNNLGRLAVHEAITNGCSLAVVEKIVEKSPERCFRMSDADGKLPIHSLGQTTPLQVAQYLMKKTPPEYARLCDDEGRLPLHCAIAFLSSVEVIEWLMMNDKYLENTLCKADRRGRVAMHMILDSSSSNVKWKDEVLRLISIHSPKVAFGVTDSTGRLPIHCMKRLNRVRLATLRQLMSRLNPECLLLQDERGRLPIHVALEDPSLTVEKALLFCDKQFECLHVADNDGRLPLHFAALHQTDVGIVLMILNGAKMCAEDMILWKDNNGVIPLHFAVQRRLGRPSEAFVRLLVGVEQENAASLLTSDRSGMLALHCAICFRTSFELINLLISMCPSEVFEFTDHRNRTPLRCCIDISASNGVFQAVFARTPAKVYSGIDNDGRVLLHCLPSNVSVSVVETLCAGFPESLAIRDKYGRLPIHQAVCRRLTNRVIDMLISAYPKGLAVQDINGKTPLHLLPSNANAEVVNLLVTHSPPNALMVRDHNGQLPIHCAVLKQQAAGVISLLAKAAPTSLLQFDNDDRLPLHLALLVRSSSGTSSRFKRRRGIASFARYQQDLVTTLMAEAPESLSMGDKLGRLPLHRVAQMAAPKDMIEMMIVLNADAVKVQDKQGKLPLHYALEGGELEFESLQLLLKEFAGAVYVKDQSGCIPLRYAIQNCAELDVVYALVRLYPDLFKPSEREATVADMMEIDLA